MWTWARENPKISIPIAVVVDITFISIYILSLMTIYGYGRTIIVPPVPVSTINAPSSATSMVQKNNKKKRESDGKLVLAYVGAVISGIVVVPQIMLLLLMWLVSRYGK